MRLKEKEIIVVERLTDERVPQDFEKSYFTHILCDGGKGQFTLDNKEFLIEKNDIVIFLPTQKVQDLLFSSDFKASFLLVSFDLMSKNNPDIAWGIKGYLFSKENPVVRLGKGLAEKCKQNFYLLQEKYEDDKHRFRNEIVGLQLQMFVMEMWNIFADKMEQLLKNENGSLFQRFLNFVEIHCMEHREVEFYARQLFITPKYLSEVCKKNSGKSASEWIQNFTTSRLILLLGNDNLTFSQIADSMNFSSLSFFSRYVKKMLGVSPSEYRNRVG
ncbi:helix-turn-helix domain-containing protein [Galbibacter mesophilus]|uniref:helix-turn-helix domain-containing protein n=1 Tax=Galbibacter mesophilus TaxID=379069 RepID=UPI00191D73E5|nr:helix-turn-helix domain-containing protein [Galbibacter mesophilus]MCM5664003.1 helix-turn-helix domain-containing protein [Galbibacter mesophilus]